MNKRIEDPKMMDIIHQNYLKTKELRTSDSSRKHNKSQQFVKNKKAVSMICIITFICTILLILYSNTAIFLSMQIESGNYMALLFGCNINLIIICIFLSKLFSNKEVVKND